MEKRSATGEAGKMSARLGSVVLLVLSLAISCELGSFLVLHYAVGIYWTPDYLRSGSGDGNGTPWYTERDPWGAWHVPNAVSRQESRCFSVALRANSHGARDRDRVVDGSANRTVVLGDSFAEGWGVEAEQRLSNLLEARQGREFLNFGVANDAGPLQYQIIYQQLAAKFAHDRVLIMFLPDNDFTDNDAAYWRDTRPDYYERYRPYYQPVDGGGYRPFYPVARPPEGYDNGLTVPKDGLRAQAASWARRNIWSLAMYRFLKRLTYHVGAYSGYVGFSPEELQAVLWSFGKIKDLAGDRSVTILVIPRPTDFARVDETGDHRLIDALDSFGRSRGIAVIDLMRWMPQVESRIERYYLPCDGHWSAEGNRIAADALALAAQANRAASTAAGAVPVR
jgi:SGNH hydrolase-like domain, acetyltransferase AlgX